MAGSPNVPPPSCSSTAANEERLAALQQYDILDTDPEAAFDRIVGLVADLFQAPIAMINFLDDHRQWSKARVGISGPREADIALSFCIHTVDRKDVLAVDDVTKDSRFADNPYVTGPPHLRTYIGAPLTTSDGYAIGTICALDTEARAWTKEHERQLADFAALVMDELDMRHEVAQREHAESMLRAINENISEGIYRSTPDGTLLYVNEAMAHCFGYESANALKAVSSTELYADPARRQKLQADLRAHDNLEQEEIVFQREDGSTFIGHLSVTVVCNDDGSVRYYDGVVTDVSEQKATEEALRTSAQRWERLVNAHPEPIHVSVDGVIRYINPAGARVYGADSPDEVIGLSVYDFMADEAEHEKARQRSKEVYEDKEPTSPEEFTIRRLDGKTRTVEVRSVPIEYEGKIAAQTIVRDITAKRRLEEQLRVRQHQFRQLLDNAQPIVFVLDENGEFLISEGRDLRVLGLAPGEVVGRSVYDVVEAYPAIHDHVDRALGGETISTLVEMEDLVFDIWYAPIQDASGDVIGCIGMAVDITERRRAEAALREERDLLASIFNTSAAAITVLDTDGNIVKANTRAEEVLGLSASALVGRSYDAPEWEHEAVGGGLFPDAEQPFVQVMETEAPVYDVQHAITWPDGRRKILSINGAPIRDASGEITGAVFIVDDITEQKKQRRQLRESQLRYQTLVQHFPEGAVFLFDDDLQFILAGGSELKTFGLRSEDVQGECVSTLLPSEVLPKVRPHLQRALDDTSGMFEIDLGGAYYRVRTLPLHDDDGSLRAGMAVAQNITEDVEAEAMLRQAKHDAEEASRLKSAMLANMSHEVRTPLTSIIGFAEMLRDESSGVQQRFASLILQGGRRLLTTLDSVLHLSKLEAGTETLQVEPVDLGTLAQDIVDQERPQARGRQIALQPTYVDGPAMVETDTGAMQRIMTNLISNALKYTRPGGTVDVRIAGGRCGVLFEVADTGIGIARQFQDQMFDAFTQESAGMSREHEGSGLGLAIVRKLVALLNGTIEVESTRNHGTRVAVFVPRSQNESGENESSPVMQ